MVKTLEFIIPLIFKHKGLETRQVSSTGFSYYLKNHLRWHCKDYFSIREGSVVTILHRRLYTLKTILLLSLCLSLSL